MAILDLDRDEVVIRILYDGPPLAGKTTNLRALARIMPKSRRSELFSPAEAEGRTLYFDWMDYLGGWADGRQVRCQIVSAPGQRALASRRRALVCEADVVVFVAESTPEGAEEAARAYADLRGWLHDAGGVPVPIVLQANKQDLPGALSALEFRQRVSQDDLCVAAIPAAAQSELGVRETFTFAVRLALDRVRELGQRGELEIGSPRVRDGRELLSLVERRETRERSRITGSTRTASSHPRGSDPARRRPGTPNRRATPPAAERPPAVPDSRTPSGLVWPPVAGRIVLRDVETAGVSVAPTDGGDWVGVAGSAWRLLSASDSVWRDPEAGRRELLLSARRHASFDALLTPHRALALADTGDGRSRLWQIVRRDRSFAEEIDDALAASDHDDLIPRLLDIADELLTARQRFRAQRTPFEACLTSLTRSPAGPRYAGFLVEDAAASGPPESGDSPAGFLRSELQPLLRRQQSAHRLDVPQALSRLRRVLRERPERRVVIEALGAILIGH